VALVCILALGLLAGGGAAAWYFEDRATRRGRAQSEAEAAMREAQRWLDQEQDQEHRDPERWAAGMPLIDNLMERAEKAAATAAVDADLRERVRLFRERLGPRKRDSLLRVELDGIRLEQAAVKGGHFHFAIAVPRYRSALSTYGIDPGNPEAAAAVVRDSGLRSDLLAALDDWARLATDAEEQKQLRAVLESAEPEQDTWRARWRAAVYKGDGAALAVLARQVPDLSAADLTNLARDLGRLKEWWAAEQLLRQAQRRFPGDFWVSEELGIVLLKQEPPQAAEAVRYLQAALALRSQSVGALVNLCAALKDQGRLAEAIAGFHQAIERDSRYAPAHLNLGLALQLQGKTAEAIAAFRQAIALEPEIAQSHVALGTILGEDGRPAEAIPIFRHAITLEPGYAPGHLNLGMALKSLGKLPEAIAEYRQAIALDPKLAMAHANLGVALRMQGKLPEAAAAYRQAIACDPKYAPAHLNLGNVLKAQGQLPEAIAAFRQAIEVDPRLAEAHGALGQTLLVAGDFAEAVKETKRCLELLPPQHPLRVPVSQLLQQCELAVVLNEKLPAILRGETRPASAGEALALAQLCQQSKQMHAAAARFYAEAFAEPKLAADVWQQHHYSAACSAALAAAGQGKDADKLDGKERQRLRRHAVEWLRTDLDAWSKLLSDASARDRQAICKILEHWQQDTDLAGLRDDKALSVLPTEERAACQKLWADVAALAEKARAPR
jgi:tetratricopeptide (TPR) repeat protein